MPSSPSDRQPLDGIASAVLIGTLLLGVATSLRGREGDVHARANGHDRGADGQDLDALYEPGRGREAARPSQIPARGWMDVNWRVVHAIGENRILLVAAGVTFYGLLALFPALAALVSLYGLFADPAAISDRLQSLSGVLPDGAIEVIRDQITRIASQGTGTLGLATLIGLAVSLWSANGGIKSMFDALNVVYGEEEKRSFLELNAQSLAFTLGLIVFVVLALGAIVVIPAVLAFIGLGGTTEVMVRVLRWPALLLVVLLALAFLYRFGPSRQKPQWRWVTWGSAFAGILWLIGSMLFSWYVASFGKFNETYGSLGAAIGFMIWMWLSAIIVLIGAQINSEIEHQTARDTTTGRPKPMGTRGARMADTVGAAQTA